MRKPVLIVEDEPDIRENMQMLLEDEGYEVYSAGNGAEALAILHDENRSLPGLVALDFFMPVMDGRAFLQAVERSAHKNALGELHVVLVTASDPQSRRDLEGKTIAVLPKPVDLDRLLGLVSEHCGQPGGS